jgi:hypothetical protein
MKVDTINLNDAVYYQVVNGGEWKRSQLWVFMQDYVDRAGLGLDVQVVQGNEIFLTPPPGYEKQRLMKKKERLAVLKAEVAALEQEIGE